MKLKQKFKDMWRKIRGKNLPKKPATTDAEISVEEVTREEIFPEGKRKVTTKKTASTPTAQKPASKRTRPTNGNYKMIDPSDNSCDPSKS